MKKRFILLSFQRENDYLSAYILMCGDLFDEMYFKYVASKRGRLRCSEARFDLRLKKSGRVFFKFCGKKKLQFAFP